MTLIVSTPKRQHAIPTEGNHKAKLIEVKDVGPVQFKSEIKDKIVFVWETEETDNQGRRLTATQRFNKTLAPKSSLRAAVRLLIGRDPGDTFDLSVLIGTEAEVIVKHNDSAGVVYANVDGIIRKKNPTQGSGKPSHAVTRNADSAADAPRAMGDTPTDSATIAAKVIDEMISADSSR